ncbi:7109_t:CDS:2, partial [Dentiscutata erythropus]
MSTKSREFQFILGTSQSYKNSKTIEEEYFDQKIKVEKLLVNPAYSIYLSLEELTETSANSREGSKYTKNEREQPPRSLNPFMIFPDIISTLATQAWNEQENPAVYYLFIELADLAKKRLLYSNPEYRYEPSRKKRPRSPQKKNIKENSLA